MNIVEFGNQLLVNKESLQVTKQNIIESLESGRIKYMAVFGLKSYFENLFKEVLTHPDIREEALKEMRDQTDTWNGITFTKASIPAGRPNYKNSPAWVYYQDKIDSLVKLQKDVEEMAKTLEKRTTGKKVEEMDVFCPFTGEVEQKEVHPVIKKSTDGFKVRIK